MLFAAGLGILPRADDLPAGAGGLIGIAVAALSAHVGVVYHQAWIGMAFCRWCSCWRDCLSHSSPRDCRLRPILRFLANIPAAFLWAGSLLRIPKFTFRKTAEYDDEEHEPEFEDETDEDGYSLDVGARTDRSQPSPSAAKAASSERKPGGRSRRPNSSASNPRSISSPANISCRRSAS